MAFFILFFSLMEINIVNRTLKIILTLCINVFVFMLEIMILPDFWR